VKLNLFIKPILQKNIDTTNVPESDLHIKKNTIYPNDPRSFTKDHGSSSEIARKQEQLGLLIFVRRRIRGDMLEGYK